MDIAQSRPFVSSLFPNKLQTLKRLVSYVFLITLLLTCTSLNVVHAQTQVPDPPGDENPTPPGLNVNLTQPITPWESLEFCNYYRSFLVEYDEDQMSQCYLSQPSLEPTYPLVQMTNIDAEYAYFTKFLVSQPLQFVGQYPGQLPPQAGTVYSWLQFYPETVGNLGLNLGDSSGCNGGDGTFDSAINDSENGSGSGSYATEYPMNCATNNGAPTAGDPINFATGNYYLQEDDFVGSKWLKFSRFYNSGATTSGSIGANWRDSFDKSLLMTGSPATSIAMFRPDGKSEVFTKTNGVWTPSAGITDTLTEVDNSQGVATQYNVFITSLKHYETYIPITDASGSVTGQLQTVTDETGQGITLTYSSSTTPPADTLEANLLINVTDSQGRQLNFTYNVQGYVSKVMLPDGGTLNYTYNQYNGNLLSVEFPDGSTRQYLYNEQNLTGDVDMANTMTGIVDETGTRYESTTYGYEGFASETSFAGNVGTTQIYYGNNDSYVVYPLGNEAELRYTTINNLYKVTGATAACGPHCGQPWASRSYDANNNPLSYTDFNGSVTATTFNSQGLLTQVIEAQGQATQRSTSIQWDTNLINPLQRATTNLSGSLVQETSWVYNLLGEPTARCEIDVTVSAATSYVCSAAGTLPTGVRRWTYTYCTAVGAGCPLTGLVLTANGPRTDLTQTTSYAYYSTASASNCGTPGAACYQPGDLYQVTDALGHVTKYASYDADGRVTRMTDANGVNTDTTYYPRGWVKTRTVGGKQTSFTYTAYGAVQTITDPDGVTISFDYDTAHRLMQITDALGNYIQYTLDASGDKTGESIYDSTGTLHKSLTRTFNTLGQLNTVVDGLNNTVFNASVSTSYDNNGNLVQSTDGLGFITKRSYDGLNRLKQVIQNYEGSDLATENTTTAKTYDNLDRLTEVTDPTSLSTTFSYDGLSDTTSKVSPDTGTTSQTFDAAGDVLTRTDAKGIVRTNTYDALNRLLTTTYADATQNVNYSYDDSNSTTGCSSSYPIGRLTRVIENTVTTVYCYDAQGGVTKKQQITSSSTDTTSYSYSSAERLSGIAYPSGTQVSYTRDGDGRIQSVNVTPSGESATAVVSSVTYQPFGPVSGYMLGNGQKITRTYDANYRLTDLTSPAFNLHVARDAMGDITAIGDSPGANPATETYSYDPLYRLKTVTEASGTVLESVTYNLAGDRLSKSGSGLATGTYTYNPNTHQLVATGNAARAVDADGNTTAISEAGSTYGFGYSDRNRLIVAQLGGSTIATYAYNALNERIQKVTGTATERYDYNETSQLLGEYGVTNRDYIWMDGIPVADVDSPGSSTTFAYVTADQVGTPRAITNSSGTTEWQNPYQSNPWGEAAPTSNGYTYNLRYPGQYYDEEVGINYNNFRNYDPSVGRYIQSDPIGLRGGINTYSYVGGNPYLYSDARGLLFGGLVNAGECYGQAAAEYWADAYNNDSGAAAAFDAVMGSFASLWTPNTSDATAATLATGELAPGAVNAISSIDAASIAQACILACSMNAPSWAEGLAAAEPEGQVVEQIQSLAEMAENIASELEADAGETEIPTELPPSPTPPPMQPTPTPPGAAPPLGSTPPSVPAY